MGSYAPTLIKGMHATTINMQHDIISQLELNWELWGNEQREQNEQSLTAQVATHTHTNGLNAKTKANTV